MMANKGLWPEQIAVSCYEAYRHALSAMNLPIESPDFDQLNEVQRSIWMRLPGEGQKLVDDAVEAPAREVVFIIFRLKEALGPELMVALEAAARHLKLLMDQDGSDEVLDLPESEAAWKEWAERKIMAEARKEKQPC